MEHDVLIGHLAGHLASILTMAAYLLKDILWLRSLTILSCFAGIAFNLFVPATPAPATGALPSYPTDSAPRPGNGRHDAGRPDVDPYRYTAPPRS